MSNRPFNFTQEPGKELKIEKYDNNDEILVTVITPFYNSKKYIRQTVNSVLNQTFPCFEYLIIDDGSKDEESLKELENIEKLDSRIKILHKENEGLSATRDYGASKASESSKYLVFLDDDDLIDKTFIECAYFTLECNKKAAWAYADPIGFDGDNYTWNKWFDSKRMKKVNDLVSACMIRKKDFNEVGGYELREKAVNEDWNLWLKMIAAGKYPVRMNYYGLWYRRKVGTGELQKSRENKKRALEIIENTRKKIKRPVKAIQYPKYDYNWDMEDLKDIPKIKRQDNSKINILMIIPWMVMGGADKFNLELISRLDKEKFDITIITTEPGINDYRQEFEKHSTIYDLTTFLDQKYWLSFVDYIMSKNNINLIFNTNSEMGYSLLPFLKAKYPNIPIIDYVHMEEWYNRNGGYSRDSSMDDSIIDKTLTCNENSRRVLIDNFGRKEEEIKTVYIGVNKEKFNPDKFDKDTLKEKYNIPKGKFIISYICRITEQKRPFLLLEIIKEFTKNRKDCLFLIVGDGNLLQQVKAKANKLKINDYILFLGSTDDTGEIYTISDITLNCSIKEGLALTSYESLSMGVPTISSDVGGQKELINEDVGVIVPCMQKEKDINIIKYKEDEIMPYVQAIEKILNNLDTYKSKCRQRILEKFTLNQMIQTMTEIFENVSQNPSKEKIENGEALGKNINITKELFNKYLISNQIKYEWQCFEYNSHFGYKASNYRFERFKEIMWTHKWYRGLIKLIKMTGIKGHSDEI